MAQSSVLLALQILQPVIAVVLAASHLSHTLFSLHPALMGIAFIGFIGQGILTSHQARQLDGSKRTQLLLQHALWQVLGLTTAAAGVWAVYQSKVVRGTPHWTNRHAWTGLTTLALAAMASVGGTIAFGRTGLLQCMPKDLRPVIKAAHRNAGVVTILVSTAAMELGLVMPTAYQGALSHWMQGTIGVMALLIAYLAWAPQPAEPQRKSQ